MSVHWRLPPIAGPLEALETGIAANEKSFQFGVIAKSNDYKTAMTFKSKYFKNLTETDY